MPDRRTLWFLVAILAALTFIPILQSGYTTADDADNAIGVAAGWRSPWIFDAQFTGRLQHVFTGRLLPLSYGWGHYWLSKSAGIAAIASNVAALFLLLRLVTGDARFAVLAVTLFFAFIQNTWDHNLLTAYPVNLSIALTLFFGAIGAWWMALERSQPSSGSGPPGAWSVGRLRTISLTLFGVSLMTYEAFMPYVAVFPVVAITLTPGSWRERVRAAVRTPHLVVLALFVVALVLFRVFLYSDAGRAGNTAQQYELNLSPVAVWKVLERYGSSAFPMHYFRVYKDLINDFYLGYGAFRTRLLDIFKVFEAAWLVKAAIVGFLVWSASVARTRVRHRGVLLFLVFVFLLLTNLPIAVTTKYQVWVIQNYSRGYLTSYFTLFGVVILFAMVLDGLAGLASRGRPAWAKTAAGVLASAAFVVSYGTDFVNAHVAESQRQMFDRTKAVDAWVDSPLFKAMPEHSVVFAPTLWDKYPGATHLWDHYWTYYVLHRGYRERYEVPVTRNRVNMIHVLNDVAIPGTMAAVQRAEAAGRLYYLKLVREPRSDLSYIVFARLPSLAAGQPFGSEEAWLLTHARSDHLRVNGRVFHVEGACRARVLVDDVPSRGTFDGAFAVHVDHHWAAEAWRSSRLTVKGGLLDPETIAVSESAEPVDGAVEVRYGEGFFDDEVAHRWAGNEARLAVLNRTDRAMEVDVRFELRAPWATQGSAHRVTVKAGGKMYDWPIGTAFATHAIRLEVPPRMTVDVAFSTTAPRIDPNRDGRNLVLMFLPSLRVQEVGCE